MKQLKLFLLFAFLLSSCAPATTSIPTSIQKPTQADRLNPANTIVPVTLTPSATPIPALPSTVEIRFDPSISEHVRNVVITTVTQAYWYYVALGCSPDGFTVKITPFDSGEVQDYDGFTSGWDGPQTDSHMEIRLSHETAHVMCEYEFTKKRETGEIDFRWLTEGFANYLSAMERIANSQMIDDYPTSNIEDNTIGMAQWISENFCRTSLWDLGSTNAVKILPEFAGVGDVATRLLVKTTSNGIKDIFQYYTLLAAESKNAAFQDAFDVTAKDYSKQFQQECEQGFPTLYPPMTGTSIINGNVILSDKGTSFNHYSVILCKSSGYGAVPACSEGRKVSQDGSFSIRLDPGNYIIEISVAGKEYAPLAFYDRKGYLIDLWSCVSPITVLADQTITITLDLANIKVCS